eukprot:1185442-Prorocentrum_minimum.AAC.2
MPGVGANPMRRGHICPKREPIVSLEGAYAWNRRQSNEERAHMPEARANCVRGGSIYLSGDFCCLRHRH